MLRVILSCDSDVNTGIDRRGHMLYRYKHVLYYSFLLR